MYRWILTYLSMKIEWNWRRILRNRRRMESLVGRGEPYTSRLGFEARRMEELYCLVQRRAA